MRNKKAIWIYLFFPFFLVCNILAAQIPVREEPHHRVVFENEYIRVLDGNILPHDTTLAHIHAAGSVVVFLSKSIFAIQVVGEMPVVTEVSPGDIKYAAYDERPIAHKVWNQDISPFHFMVIEMVKEYPGNDTCAIISRPGVELQWQQKLVRTYDLDFGKGRQYHLPKSNCAYLLIDISGIIRTISSGSVHSLQAGGYVYFPAQNNIQVKCNNKKHARCVLLELK